MKQRVDKLFDRGTRLQRLRAGWLLNRLNWRNTAAFIAGNRYLNGETIRLDGAVRLAAK